MLPSLPSAANFVDCAAIPSVPRHAATLNVARTLRRLQSAKTLDGLYQSCVTEIRALTGYDRVTLYRFEQEGHGKVIGESLSDGMQPYLGLCFPASDIPPQARELYRLNWIRVIPDATYQPVPILPALRPDNGQPLDLSFAVLRSVSPVHCQYLNNMGVRSSMSISLLKDDRLWGLITLLEDLIDMSRIEAGRYHVALQALDVTSTLDQIGLMWHPLAAAKGLNLTWHAQPGLLIQADPERLFQVFSNLLGNALKFTEQGSVFSFRLPAAGSTLVE